MTVVKPLRTISLWVVVALVLSGSASGASASWQCEGRTCGTSMWFCCCAAPDGSRDLRCDAPNGPSASNGATNACPAGCSCVMVVRNVDHHRANAPAHNVAPAYHPVMLPPALGLLPTLPTERVARAAALRGPPPASSAVAAPTLRGPPSLTLPLISL